MDGRPNHALATLNTLSCRSLPTLLLLLAVVSAARPVLGQDSGRSTSDTLRVTLPALRVEATRGAFGERSTPAAISVMEIGTVRGRSEPSLALENLLTELPGLWLTDRNHLALGERLVVRGLGSRAAFGVRSVSILLDGVLLTMPDGQAVLDPVEPSLIRRVELIRGPASRFWGNAAGGVLVLDSAELPTEALSGSIRALAGTLGDQQVVAELGLRGNRHRTAVWASHLSLDGFREHARGSIGRLGLRSQVPVGTGVLALALHASDLDTESPGSLTRSQWDEAPRQADPRYVSTSSGKRAQQVQASVGLTTSVGGGLLSTNVFGVTRSLDNPLPFGWVGVERVAAGTRSDWQWSRNSTRVGFGTDWRIQRDDRINTDNDGGQRGSDIDLDQTETISGLGVSVLATAAITSGTELSAGVRLDRLTVTMDDHLTADGDQSGTEHFVAASPSVGVTVDLGPGRVFFAWSSAFEIPTTTELVNRPDGLGGFNPDLEPQHIRGVEAGIRAAHGTAAWDVSAYRQQLTNFLSPYQLDAFPGRTFYSNVGEVTYLGVEAAFRLNPGHGLTLEATANLHRYRFATGSLDGQTVPGIPMRFGSFRLAWECAGLLPSARLRWADSQYGDDANTDEIAGFVVLDLRLAHAGLKTRGAQALPFLEIANVTNADYASSVVVNARGGRYYEANPGRTLRAGLSVGF